MSARVEPTPTLQKEWWLRTLLVLQSPRSVFAALRDDSTEAADARQEPMIAVVFLAGIAAVLSIGAASTLLDSFDYHALLVAVWAVLAGGMYGVASYWVAGGALYLGGRAAESTGTYRRARHLLGLASTPLVLWLVAVFPVRLALYGGDLFRSGGGDEGSGRWVFDAIGIGFLVWVAALLLLGVRTVNAWTWRRSIAAVGAAVLFLLLFGALFVVV